MDDLTLQQLCSAIVDCEHKTAPTQNEGYPSIRTVNIGKGNLLLQNVNRVSEEIYREWTKRAEPLEGDLILAREAPVGNVAIIPANLKVCLGQRTVLIRPNSAIVEPKYLMYRLLSEDVQKKLILLSGGGTVHHLNVGDIRSLVIPDLPPLAEQRKIAAILGTWDAAIASVEQLIAALQARKQGLMQRLLTGEVRFPEFEGSEWEEVELGDYVYPIVRTEQVKSDREYNLVGVRWYLEGAHIHNIVKGEDFVTQSLSRIEEDDILYNKMWVSKAAFAVAKKEHAGAYGSGEYPQFRANEKLNVYFLEYAYHNPRFLHDATSLCRGTTGRIRLHPNDFLRLKINLPSLEEQTKIADCFQTLDGELSDAKEYLYALKLQKRALMEKQLTGQVRVNVADELVLPGFHAGSQ